ncbi:MAG: hypothetical protein IT424_10795 [Pirellulales bacterium]|nr:hypothetical protein [Pirellulales bacterium]
MKIDFFSIEGPDGFDLNGVLNAVNQTPNDNARVQELADVPFRVQTLQHSRGIWVGEIIRIRMNDVPIICGLDGRVDEVDLEDDEGIGEETAFLIHPATRVLAIQRNRMGVSPSRLMQYFARFAGVDGIFAHPVLKPDVAVALNRLQIVRKMHVRFAGITNPKLLTAHNPNTADAIAILNDTAPVIDITVAMGRQRGSLSVQAIRAAARRFLTWSRAAAPPGDIMALKIEGTFDDDSPADLNLLEYRLTEQADVVPDPHSRRLLYEDRASSLRAAFARNKDDLEEMFGLEQ